MHTPTIADAVALAAEKHRDATDKGGAPYILHPLRVMLAMTTDEARRVAVLHDVIEDAGVTPDELQRRGYPDREVAALVALTKRTGEDYATFIERVRPDPLAATVKRADLLDNMDVRRLSAFGAADAERMARYLAAWRRLSGGE
ncbi:GTP pyrophosphokinase [Anaeromyxobacter terrae]|uniref:GTP pyrophosphokinase n=1 Tax=Anaeromyxobacter terrae TaxID=2925406 RepID=UPI001F5A85DC|nr:GTP pyrophosphokinase [Anaeromyxobacter sp. SG22]